MISCGWITSPNLRFKLSYLVTGFYLMNKLYMEVFSEGWKCLIIQTVYAMVLFLLTLCVSDGHDLQESLANSADLLDDSNYKFISLK